MTEKFLTAEQEISKETAQVEVLGCIGDVYSYCQALVISKNNTEHYILYNPQMYYNRDGSAAALHWKVSFENKEALQTEFAATVQRLHTDASLNWVESDDTLGLGVEPENISNAQLAFSRKY